MGYTTDLAVGVWVGNSNNAKTNNVLGASGAAPIWHNFMVEVHQRPELARNLVDPNGNAYPTAFAVPPGIEQAAVCPGTGKKAQVGSTAGTPVTAGAVTARGATDFFPKSQPGVPCGVLTQEENDELAIALRSIDRDGGKFSAGARESVQAYRAAATNYRPPGGGPVPSAAPGASPGPSPTPRRR